MKATSYAKIRRTLSESPTVPEVNRDEAHVLDKPGGKALTEKSDRFGSVEMSK
jgi:hypothetical protein